MQSIAIFSLLAYSALACAPVGTPGTGATSTSATFTMSVKPPGAWSYPLTAAAIRAPQLSTTKEQAQARINKEILAEINLILIENKYPVDAIKLTVDPVDIKGNIIELATAGTCTATDDGIILAGDTIDSSCAAAVGPATPFPPVKITGTFDAKASGIPVTEAMWKGLALKLQKSLTGLSAVFTEDLVATPAKA